MSLHRTLHVLKCFMTSIHRQSSEDLTFSFTETLSQSLTVVHQCIRRHCLILPPNVWVVFKIYFAILHNIVARNNVQHCMRLNKQKEEKKRFMHLHYIRVVMLHIWVVCFEHMAAWKRCCDMQKVCGYIFEDHKRHNV